jgi:hypothetical protein
LLAATGRVLRLTAQCGSAFLAVYTDRGRCRRWFFGVHSDEGADMCITCVGFRPLVVAAFIGYCVELLH